MFKEPFIGTARHQGPVDQVNNTDVGAAACIRILDSDPPRRLIGLGIQHQDVSSEVHDPLVPGKNPARLIRRPPFGDSSQIQRHPLNRQINAARPFIQNNQLVIDKGKERLNLSIPWHIVRTRDIPQLDERADRGIERPSGELGDLKRKLDDGKGLSAHDDGMSPACLIHPGKLAVIQVTAHQAFDLVDPIERQIKFGIIAFIVQGDGAHRSQQQLRPTFRVNRLRFAGSQEDNTQQEKQQDSRYSFHGCCPVWEEDEKIARKPLRNIITKRQESYTPIGYIYRTAENSLITS